MRLLFLTNQSSGTVGYEIAHTERTWGDDISNILNNKIKSAARKQDKHAKLLSFIRKASVFFTLFLPLIICESYLRAKAAISTEQIMSKLANSYDTANVSIQMLDSKLDAYLKLLDVKVTSDPLILHILMLLTGVLLAVMIGTVTKHQVNSFVDLTEESSKTKDKALLSESKKKWFVVISFITSILAGVSANFIYNYIK